MVACTCIGEAEMEGRDWMCLENAAREGSWEKLAELASIWIQMEREKSELFIYLIFDYSLVRPKVLCSPINMATTDQFMSITSWPTSSHRLVRVRHKKAPVTTFLSRVIHSHKTVTQQGVSGTTFHMLKFCTHFWFLRCMAQVDLTFGPGVLGPNTALPDEQLMEDKFWSPHTALLPRQKEVAYSNCSLLHIAEILD